MDNQTKRSSFTGKLGFILAAAGSAVGLGNLWRFPYLAAKYGGGIFLLVYLILAVTFGFALMTAEIAIGRKTGLSAIGAFKKLSNKFSFVGYIAAIVPVLILPYYCVIGGWVMKYLYEFATGDALKTVTIYNINEYGAGHTFFIEFVTKIEEPLFWFALFIGITALIVLFGVEKGIEKVSKFMMPVLAVLAVVLAVYSCTLDGAWDGVMYYLTPNFANFKAETVLAAMGQLFYSMSLAMGIMITYGSYMKKDVSIESSVKSIEIFDTGIAFLAGLMVIPAVFAHTGSAPVAPGPGLMFESLPNVFYNMPFGQVIGAVFFILVFFAALTSSISLMETVVSFCLDKFKIGRKTACLIVLLVSIVIGLPSALGFGLFGDITPLGMDFLTFFDFLTNSVVMPIVALFTCIIVGYIVKTKAIEDEVELNNVKFKKKYLFRFVIKYFAPICIVLILITSILDAFKIGGFSF